MNGMPVPGISPGRRKLLTLLLTSPFAQAFVVRAQTQSVPVVGFLNSASSATYSFNASAFKEGLRAAGFVVQFRGPRSGSEM